MNEWAWSSGEMMITGEKKNYAEINLSQCYFIHYKSHLDWPGNESDSPRWKAGDLPPQNNPSHECDSCVCAVFHITSYFGLSVIVLGLGR